MPQPSQLVKNEYSLYDSSMPKVSAEHLAARRAQILLAARECFAEQGFHRTSMADVLARSELSAGAVYRYFRSKEEIVAAIATEAGDGVRRLIDAMLAEPQPRHPLDAFEELLSYAAGERPGGAPRIAVQVWAEALRDPALHARVATTFTTMRDGFAQVTRRAREAGIVSAEVDPEAMGRLLLTLVPGFVLRRLLVEQDLTARAFVADIRPLVVAGGLR